MGLPHTASIAQSAAFAMFEALKRSEDRLLDRAGLYRLRFARAVDPASCGLAWTDAEDEALQLSVVGAPAGMDGTLWVHARCDQGGPVLAAYMERERPVLQTRFSGATFVASGPSCFLLRERITFPSHDGRHREREAIVRRLARAWGIPVEEHWLVIGHWNALESAWEPEAARRFAAAAVVLHAARHLSPEWLEG